MTQRLKTGSVLSWNLKGDGVIDGENGEKKMMNKHVENEK